LRVLAIVHEEDAGPGVFADSVRTRGDELHSWMLPSDGPPWLDPRDYDAVMTFGGAMNPDEDAEHPWLAEEKALLADLLERGVPLLGVCLGAELLAEAAGARAQRMAESEIGWHEVATELERDPVVGVLPPRFDALEWHSYETTLPSGAIPLARSERCLQAFRVGDRAWGIQFHAEVTQGDFESWLRTSEDAPPDAEQLRARTRERISGWNELGRALCGRFLAVAAGR
jgi:GMP synthase-like glutamine amidotransferase